LFKDQRHDDETFETFSSMKGYTGPHQGDLGTTIKPRCFQEDVTPGSELLSLRLEIEKRKTKGGRKRDDLRLKRDHRSRPRLTFLDPYLKRGKLSEGKEKHRIPRSRPRKVICNEKKGEKVRLDATVQKSIKLQSYYPRWRGTRLLEDGDGFCSRLAEGMRAG